MLKKAVKAIRRLGSNTKLQEHDGRAADAPAAAPPAPQLPPGLPRPPTPSAAVQAAPASQQQQRQQQMAPAAAAPHAAAAAEGGGRPASSPQPAAAPSPREQHQPLGMPGEPLVDYELVAGPLELDTAEEDAAGLADPAAEAAAEAAAAAQLAACSLDHQQLPPGGGEVCYDACGEAGALGAEEAAAAAAAAAVAALEAGGHGGGPAHEGAGPSGSGAAEGGAGSGGGGAGGGVEGISDALAAMMYLTEDAEGGDDCVSVVSDALSDDKDLPDDISELSRALEALEGEALHGSSPGTPSARATGSGGLDDQLAERLGISPDAGDPTAFAQQMAKLYNNLGLKMMERRKHEEALGLLRKAEAVVDNAALWQGAPPARRHKRDRMRAITYNNLGCLFKRRNMPGLALQYLQKALALEEAGGPVQNSSSTHLNICAALSALKRPKEALAHAERAIILLQRHLWPPGLAFQEGLAALVRSLAAPSPAARQALGAANVLAMAYHNAAVEHEKLGRLREALVSFTRAYLIASKCLGARAQMTTALSRALKAFQQRQARHLPAGAAHAARKAPSLASARAAASAAQAKRGHSRSSAKASAAASKSGSSLASKGLAGAASGKATLPLDKGRTTGGASGVGVRPPSSSRLASQLLAAQQQQQQQQQQPHQP